VGLDQSEIASVVSDWIGEMCGMRDLATRVRMR